MVTIHYQYYPHIIDAIFAYAPPASLAVMAKTCREWRQRCLGRFYHIFDLRVLKAHLVLRADLRLPTSKHGYNAVILGKDELPLLDGCRVMDITSDSSPRTCWFLPNLDTLRYRCHLGRVLNLPTRQIVCLGSLSPMTKVNSTVKRLVIHSRDDNGYGMPFCADNGPNLSGLTGLQQLVLIFEDPPSALNNFANNASESGSDSGSDHAGESINDGVGNNSGESNNGSDSEDEFDWSPAGDRKWTLSVIRATIQCALELHASVVLVGTEMWSRRSFNELHLGIERMYVGEAEVLAHCRPITLMTVNAYRSYVGEKEWAVETDWINPLTP